MAQGILTHVEIRETRAGQQRAFITGTRLRVADVYVCHELQGLSPDQIVAAYPQLSLGQVHGALSYFFDHADEIRREIHEDDVLIKTFQTQFGPGPLATKLNRDDNSVSS